MWQHVLQRHVCCVQCTQHTCRFSNGSRHSAEKVLCTPSTVPAILDRSQPNFHRLSHMRGKCGMWIFTKITSLKPEIQPKRYFVLEVKCPLLVTDRNQTYIMCSACVERARCELSGKSFQLKPKSSRESTLLFNSCTINYWRNGNEHVSFVAHAWEVGRMNFKTNLLNGSRDTIDKVIRTPSKGPLIFNRSQLNLLHSCRIHENCEVIIFRTVPPIKAEIRPRRHTAVHVTFL